MEEHPSSVKNHIATSRLLGRIILRLQVVYKRIVRSFLRRRIYFYGGSMTVSMQRCGVSSMRAAGWLLLLLLLLPISAANVVIPVFLFQ
jgi:hypothetical protein